MALTFSTAGHLSELDLILESIERLENLAYQAERMYWDMAKGMWESGLVVDHSPRNLCDELCANAQAYTEDILKRLCRMCGETYSLLTLSADIALYSGGEYLQQQLDAATETQSAGGIQIVTLDQAAAEENTYLKMPTAIAVTDALKKKMNWLRGWIWNAHVADTWAGYEALLGRVYNWCRRLIENNIGTAFPTPLTSYYSLATTGTYSLPKLRADASVANLLTLSCITQHSLPGFYTAPQGGTGTFHQIAAGDAIHIAKMEIEGYEEFVDKVYLVDSVNLTSITLAAPAEETIAAANSEPSTKFGDIWILRKLRSA